MAEPRIPYPRFLRRFFVYRFLADFVFLYAVYVLLFRLKGLSPFRISLLLAMWCGFVLLLELPTGMLADRWRRTSMMSLGMLAKASAFTVWSVAEGFWVYAAGFLLWSVQETFCSGTEEAFLFDSLRKYGREAEYDRIAGRGHFWSRTGAGLSILTGALLASRNLEAVAPLSAVAMAGAFLVTLGFHEPERLGKSSVHGGLRSLVREAVGNGSRRPVLRWLAYSGIVLAVVGALDEYEQLYFHGVGLPVAFFGTFTVLRMGFEALGSRIAYRLRRRLGSRLLVSILPLISGSLLAVSIVFASIPMILLFAGLFCFGAAAEVLVEAELQEVVGSARRATFFSIRSLVMNGGALILILLFAGIVRAGGLDLGFGFFACILMGYSVLSFLRPKNRDDGRL